MWWECRGLRHLAMTGDGVVFENARPLGHALNELRKVNRAISRPVKCHDRQTGNRRRKLYLRTSRLYEQVSNIEELAQTDGVHVSRDGRRRLC